MKVSAWFYKHYFHHLAIRYGCLPSAQLWFVTLKELEVLLNALFES